MEIQRFFENAFSEVHDKAPFSNDETFTALIKERTEKMNKHKSFIRKPAVAAAAVLSAAVIGSVSVGAATNWDIAALFSNSNSLMREWRENKITEKGYPENINVPENVSPGLSAPAGELEILNSVSHTLDKTIEREDYIIHLLGYVTDGKTTNVLYEITYKNGYDSVKDDPIAKHPVTFGLKVKATPCYAYGIGERFISEGDTSVREAVIHIDTSDDVKIVKLLICDREMSDKIGDLYILDSVDLDLSADNIKTLEFRFDKDTTFGDGTPVTINDVLITPLSAQISVTNKIEPASERTMELPVYITYNDGTVIDISSYMSDFTMAPTPREDGLTDWVITVSSGGNAIDVDNIRSVQIINEIIDIER